MSEARTVMVGLTGGIGAGKSTVARLLAERVAAAPEGSVVVQDVPLLVESGLAGLFELVVVVDAADSVRVARLMRDRGMTEQEASARIAAQAPREQRLAAADVVLNNDGTPEDLADQVAALWNRIGALGRTPR